MADRVGFEPTSRLRDYLISSQGRYDHFDTYPYIRRREAAFSAHLRGLLPAAAHEPYYFT